MMKVEALDGFVVGCGANGSAYLESRVTPTLDRVSDCSCATCQEWVRTGGKSWLGGGRTDLVPALLGFCGCVAPDEIDAQFLAYLDGLAGWWDEVRASDDGSLKLRLDLPPRPDYDLLTAYLCDALGWTEHGGSVGGAWLTDAGEQALANLRAALTDDGEETP